LASWPRGFLAFAALVALVAFVFLVSGLWLLLDFWLAGFSNFCGSWFVGFCCFFVVSWQSAATIEQTRGTSNE